MRNDTTDEYYGTLTIEELEDLVKKGSTKQKRAARTELKEREAMKQLEETKKEETLRVIDRINRELSVKEFVGLTGMNKNTARRELGQAVKRGDIVRVRRGVYRFK
jgi:Fic family protein